MTAPARQPDAPPDDPGPSAALAAQVVATLPQVAGAAWVPLAGGRVNRLWQAGAVVVKLYAAAGGSPLFPNDAVAEADALRFAAPHGLAPELLGAGPHGDACWIAYAHVAGQPWRQGAAVAGRLLARLHALPAPDGLPLRTGGSTAVLAAAAVMGGAPWPAPADPGIAAAPPAPLHGDPVPGNIIVGPRGARLIDWQCPGRGDPAEDLALFLSPAMQWLYRGVPLSGDEVGEFLAAYGDAATVARYRALAPVLHWRIAAHCRWRARRGDAGYARAMALERPLCG